MGRVLIGTSGWNYPNWRGVFYPRGLAQRLELAYLSRRLPSVEVNGTFYSLKRPADFAAWREATPPGFVFSLKGGRYITHMKQLRDVRGPLANYFAQGVLALGEKLGPIVWQLPPRMKFDEGKLRGFFELLPRDSREAAKLAREHGAHLEGRALTKADGDRPIRHALEFRHESFRTPEAIALLREHKIGLVVADIAGLFATAEDVTADFVYLRLHGARRLYAGAYTEAELKRWAAKIEAWRTGGEPEDADRVGPAAKRLKRGRDVYVYFDNTDHEGAAPDDALTLAEMLGAGADSGEAGAMEALAAATASAGSPRSSGRPAAVSRRRKR